VTFVKTIIKVKKHQNLCSIFQLLVTANVVPSLLILFTLVMKAICSSETSVIIRATWHHSSEDGILLRHRHENLKSYMKHDLWFEDPCKAIPITGCGGL
jgi:hypothetical protein